MLKRSVRSVKGMGVRNSRAAGNITRPRTLERNRPLIVGEIELYDALTLCGSAVSPTAGERERVNEARRPCVAPPAAGLLCPDLPEVGC